MELDAANIDSAILALLDLASGFSSLHYGGKS
jgi:hypothetical protein